jgi:erythronate-4-phosphate dehydrogenase
MKIIADNKIPFLKGLLEPYADIIYKAGAETTAADVKDADALITRTRTKCNQQLLEGSQVKMIATATVGFDHIDTAYCDKKEIGWTNAPGCNSGSVLQYVAASLALLSKEFDYRLEGKKIAIIGVGNVGKKVERLCHLLKMEVIPVDPIRAISEPELTFADYEDAISRADIITYHTPLTMDGEYATYHMLNNDTLAKLKKGVVVINASRGEVASTQALLKGLEEGIIWKTVIDVWENEPDIDRQLLEQAWIATPHIAGYSIDSKAIGTTMAVQAINDHFKLGMPPVEINDIPQPQNPVVTAPEGCPFEEMIAGLILHTYPIREDDNRFRLSPETFEKQRGDYPIRREFAAYTVVCREEMMDTIAKFGFRTRKS